MSKSQQDESKAYVFWYYNITYY